MHPKQEILEDKLAALCQALDNHLEDIYGDRKAGTGTVTLIR